MHVSIFNDRYKELREARHEFAKERLIPYLQNKDNDKHGWEVKVKGKAWVRLWMKSDRDILGYFDIKVSSWDGKETPMINVEDDIQLKDSLYWKDCSAIDTNPLFAYSEIDDEDDFINELINATKEMDPSVYLSTLAARMKHA